MIARARLTFAFFVLSYATLAEDYLLGAFAVEPRATTSGSKNSSSADTTAPSIWPPSISTAARPIASSGCRTVVSGGSVQLMNAQAAKPTPQGTPGSGRRHRQA